jgi:hypothetical protein
MRRKRLQGLVAALVVAVPLAAPTVASATPQWLLNGVLAGPTKQNVTQFGTLTLQSKFFGEFKCKIIAGAPVWNESGKGFNAVEAWQQAGMPSGGMPSQPLLAVSTPISPAGPVCSYTGEGPGCKQQAFVTDEAEPELIENSEIVFHPGRAKRTVPWPGELFETTEKTTSLNMHKIKIYLDCPTEGLEVVYEGNLEPRVVNGVRNGMSPSKLVFEGQGGKTSYLVTCDLEGCVENERTELFVSGELTMLGTSQELISAK